MDSENEFAPGERGMTSISGYLRVYFKLKAVWRSRTFFYNYLKPWLTFLPLWPGIQSAGTRAGRASQTLCPLETLTLEIKPAPLNVSSSIVVTVSLAWTLKLTPIKRKLGNLVPFQRLLDRWP